MHLKNVDIINLNSEEIKEKITKLCIINNKIEVIQYGIYKSISQKKLNKTTRRYF